ncbi:hypothetical protein JGY85_00540 [Shigella sonnei]|nr:hypothetical protein [Shigella sonnei]
MRKVADDAPLTERVGICCDHEGSAPQLAGSRWCLFQLMEITEDGYAILPMVAAAATVFRRSM